MIVSFRGANEMEIGSMIQRWTRKAQRHREVDLALERDRAAAATAAWCVVCGEPSYSPSCYGPTDGRATSGRHGWRRPNISLSLNRSEQPFASISHATAAV